MTLIVGLNLKVFWVACEDDFYNPRLTKSQLIRI